MKKQDLKSNCKDDDYDVDKAPKRSSYKKIKHDVKQEMIKRHFQDQESISDLSRLFHLSYSTIAHILRTYHEKQIIFQSKRSKMMRVIEESVKIQNQQSTQKSSQEEQKSEIKMQPVLYYPFAAYWPYY